MRGRQCARAGCCGLATATFTFDAGEQTVWLDPPSDGNARAGELCDRHANRLVPPQGWRLDDRRQPPPEVAPPEVAPPELAPAPAPELVPQSIDAMLVAHSPLLARAFQAAGN